MAATTRAITIASNSTYSILAKKPFLGSRSLRLNNLKVSSTTTRSFTCKAIYYPEVTVKEDGQPQTLDYRVFFHDKSGKKVLFFSLGQFGYWIFGDFFMIVMMGFR
jgi:inorganic pyrophosphatase